MTERGDDRDRRTGPFAPDEGRAFDSFVRAHRAWVVQVALAALGPGADLDAEDVVQEVLLRTFARRDTLRSAQSLRAWLARSTVHAAISSRRRARWRRPHLAVDEQPDPPDRAANQTGEAARALRTLVMTLPDHERVAVHLHYWMGYDSGEIARILGCAEVTVRSRLLRARRRLHGALREQPISSQPSSKQRNTS